MTTTAGTVPSTTTPASARNSISAPASPSTNAPIAGAARATTLITRYVVMMESVRRRGVGITMIARAYKHPFIAPEPRPAMSVASLNASASPARDASHQPMAVHSAPATSTTRGNNSAASAPPTTPPTSGIAKPATKS